MTTKREWLERRYATEPERPGRFSTVSDMEVEPLYTALDVPAETAEQLGVPGTYPYTRGIHPTGYRGKLWTKRQFAGFGSARDTNERFKFLLEHGQTGLSVAFDFPTLMGYDSDHPRSEGEVGKTGVAISSLADMEVLFDGIDLLDKVQEMADNPVDVTGIPTGFADLDRMTSGLQAGDMIVLAAARIYGAIGRRVVELGPKAWDHRVVIGRIEKLRHVAAAFAEAVKNKPDEPEPPTWTRGDILIDVRMSQPIPPPPMEPLPDA